MSAVRQLLSGFRTREEEETFQAQVARVKGLLADTPLNIFNAGEDFALLLKLHGAETYKGINPENLSQLEEKILSSKQLRESLFPSS